MESGEDVAKNPITRRSFLKKGAGAGIALVLGKQSLDQRVKAETPEPSKSPELSSSPEIIPLDPIEYGFNTHLNNEAKNMSLEMFKRGVDMLADNNQEWIRFNLFSPHAITGGDTTEVFYDEDKMGEYDQAIAYAKEKGLKISLVTNTPDFANHLSHDDYLLATSAFYTDIAKRFKGKIDVWQIFNEANVHDFRNYNERPELADSYLTQFSQAVAAASAAIREHDPTSRTTVNISHWVGDHGNLVADGSRFFDSVKDSIDIVTLDLYPDDDLEEINRFPEYIEQFSNRYEKPVVIGEIGWPTFKNGFTAEDRINLMNASVDAMRSGNVLPESIIFYELADEEGISEYAFGVLEYDGIPDESFNGVIGVMQREDEKTIEE